MAFRIRHKPTGRYLKKRSCIWASLICCLQENIKDGTTDKVGHMYATLKGAEDPFRILTDKTYQDCWYKEYPKQPNDWEIVEG